MSRPEAGELVVGQDVVVRLSTNQGRYLPVEKRFVSARITNLGRVWIDLESVERNPHRQDSPAEVWRMRRDTQDEGNLGYSHRNARFATLDQHVYDIRRDQAIEFLREQGIDLNWRGPWSSDDMRLKLADIIRTAIESEETA